MSDRDAAFEEYFAARSDVMRGTAYLLCGDWHRAEDLVQSAFTKLYLAWKRIDRHGSMDAYTRTVLVRTFLSERRRGWFKFESVSDDLADAPASPGGDDLWIDREALLEALAKVPPRQRAVIVLRYWEDMSIEQTAEVLKCSEGTVKSQSARGLQTLRGLLAQMESA